MSPAGNRESCGRVAWDRDSENRNAPPESKCLLPLVQNRLRSTIAKAIPVCETKPMLTALRLFDLQVTFESDDVTALRAVRDVYPDAQDADGVGNSIYIVIRISQSRCDGQIDAITVSGSRIDIQGPSIRGAANAQDKTGWCEVPSGLLDEPQSLTEIVDCLVLFLVTHSGRTPLHACAVLMGDTALVLAGRSGAGKSRLALAAARANLPVLTDDSVYLQTEPRLTVWGLSRPVHVFEKDAPGVAGPKRWRAGRLKNAITLPSRAPKAEQAILCLLEHGTRIALRPLGVEDAIAELMAGLEPGFDLFRGTLPQTLRAMAPDGAWRLTLSADPDEAIALLQQRFTALCG